MRHTRKIASLLLALVMVFALATTAFAADETGTITVDNPIAGEIYTAYKIFDVVYDKDESGNAGTHYSYTISGTSEWFGVVAQKDTDGTVTSKITGLTFEKAYSEDTYVVIKGEGFSAPEFAKTLKKNTSGKTGTSLAAAGNGTVSVSNLSLGYYFVSSTNGALCNLTTTNPIVTIHDKNEIIFEKTDDTVTADVGKVVNYTLTGKVPDYTGFDWYTYEITDTMSKGLTFKKDVKVTVDGTDVTSDCTVTYDVENNANKFTVSIPVLDKKYTFGAPILVTYSAVVNEYAVAKIERNYAELKYSNDPTNDKSYGKIPKWDDVYSAKIVIDKYQKDNDTIKLAGATFVLYKEVTAEGATEATKMYYKWNRTDKKVEWVADKADATPKTTDNKGATSFDGLADGKYYLEETEAPAGYNLLKDPVEVIIDGKDATLGDPIKNIPENLSPLTVTAPIENATGAQLPSTGGIGTTIFYVMGSILVLGAAVLLVTKKRMAMNG